MLLSGGLDSATTCAIALAEGYAVFALSFNYGQRHSVELESAALVARQLAVERHLVITFDLRSIGGSALTADVAVPKDREAGEITRDIPVTYVPARNTIFLSFALAWAEVIDCEDIFIGVNSLDYSGYPDCRPEYLRAFETMANFATKSGVSKTACYRIHAPLIRMTKAEIIKKGLDLGVDYSITHSCYDPVPGGRACGRCDSCLLRMKGFAEAGVVDPSASPEKN